MQRQIKFFDEREKYLKDIKTFVKENGWEKLTKVILKTLPVDFKVLNEKPWRKQPKVWLILLKTAYLYAYKQGVIDGK